MKSMLKKLKVKLGQAVVVLPASIWTKHPGRDPLSMAFMMRLQAILWRSIIILEIILC